MMVSFMAAICKKSARPITVGILSAMLMAFGVPQNTNGQQQPSPTAPKIVPPSPAASSAIQSTPLTQKQIDDLKKKGIIPASAAGGVVAKPATAASAKPKAPSAAEAARKKLLTARLKKLAVLKFNRLPSGIMQSWRAESPAAKTKMKNADLPPAPPKAFLYDDIRFTLKTQQAQRDFSLGRWHEVGEFLKLLPEANAKKLYLSMLTSASSAAAKKLPGNEGGSSRTDPRAYQMPYLTFEDILELAKIRPVTIEKANLGKFALLFNAVIKRGASVQDLMKLLHANVEKDLPKVKDKDDDKGIVVRELSSEEAKKIAEAAKLEAGKKAEKKPAVIKPLFTKRNIALLLMASGRPLEAGEFLPDLETAQKENDYEGLNLISRFQLAKYAEDTETNQLDLAWKVTQAVLASDEVEATDRTQALSRAVKLSTQVSKKMRDEWLENTFEMHPARGIEMMSGIGADVSSALMKLANNADKRHEQLELQSKAVDAFLTREADVTGQWQKTLEIMAINWLREAIVTYESDTSKSLGPQMQRDNYGNYYYYDYRNSSTGRLTPITTTNILKVRPSDKWLKHVDVSLQPKFDMILGQLYLKVSEEDLALPYIEKLAKPYPKETEELVKEFLRVWTSNHDPNSSRRRSSYYSYMYGYESRAESIPLTRSKQQRNLRELAALLPKLQKLQKEPLDQEMISTAFFTCHSTAEVYRIEQIEQIFGDFKNVKPKVVTNIAQRMRGNLAGMWRDANEQKKGKTKRTKADIQQEVLRGYDVARQVIDAGLAANPDDWSLNMANASLMHDENNYRSDLANSTDFTSHRKDAMAEFKKAAKKYVAYVADKEEKDYDIDAFSIWFYAGLGSVDLGLVTEKRLNDPTQPPLIRELIQSMPEKQSEWHMSSFASALFNRMSSAKPHIKHRYLKAGFDVVGDHEQAYHAKQVFDYYADLVSEIKLETELDGIDQVGVQPFGMYVNLTHTKEIERESGGFGKYLQNQNSNMYYSYNYGRPTEDYRDKFEEGLRQTLAEHFEVLSVTFQTPAVKSAPTKQEGWRTTPYAYVLMKARGPEIDKIPSLKMDLDFLDTSGYAILPIESPAIPIDSSMLAARPANNVKITQTLDERQANDGKLIVEIKATAHGLVPELDTLMDISPSEFQVSLVEDQGVNVSKFDDEAVHNVILSERSWMVSFETKPGLNFKPTTFEFPEPIVETKETIYQKFVDADLATVEPILKLEEKYEVKPNYSQYTIPVFIGLACLGLLLISFLVDAMSPKKEQKKKKIEVPDDASPFTVISLLQDIQRNNGLNDNQRQELDVSINRLEEYYFGMRNGNEQEPDLTAEVKKWTKRAK